MPNTVKQLFTTVVIGNNLIFVSCWTTLTHALKKKTLILIKSN